MRTKKFPGAQTTLNVVPSCGLIFLAHKTRRLGCTCIEINMESRWNLKNIHLFPNQSHHLKFLNESTVQPKSNSG